MAEAAAAIVDKGDVAWMMTSTLLVLLMIVPGLALFYGGLVRTKNMLSVVSQVLAAAALVILIWVVFGYSLAFGSGNGIIGNLDKLFLAGVGSGSTVPTFTKNVAIPEFVYICFQMTFAAITAALIVGAVAERIKFSALMLFVAIWTSIVYLPVAHMVWASDGLLLRMGALDFAGGTVVHINAGVAGLVGVLFVGPRIGFLRDAMPPHSLAMTLVGAGLLWVGWFGFNAGSNLEANGGAGLAMINTFVAAAAGVLAWMLAERLRSGKPSLLGGASGAVAGLVAITPAAGTSGPMGGILLGAVAALVCFGFVSTIKNRLRLDDTLDVFGIHGLGGIVGSIGTGIVSAPSLGGFGGGDYSIVAQTGTQAIAVLVAILWSGVGSAIAFAVVKAVIGLRATEEAERQGLDISDHGERAYNY